MKHASGWIRARRALAAAGVALITAVGGALVAPQPAAASEHDVFDWYERDWCLYYASPLPAVCFFWYGDGTGAHTSVSSFDANLSDNTFNAGSGDGAGYSVYDNAAAAECDLSRTYCFIFAGTNYTGNDDRIYSQQGGTLFFAWNHTRSMYYY